MTYLKSVKIGQHTYIKNKLIQKVRKRFINKTKLLKNVQGI